MSTYLSNSSSSPLRPTTSATHAFFLIRFMIVDVEVGTLRTHGCICNLCGTMARREA